MGSGAPLHRALKASPLSATIPSSSCPAWQPEQPRTHPRIGGCYTTLRGTIRVEDGTVSVHAAAEPEEDPALAPFLALLERDITARPEALVPLTPELAARMAAATEGVKADPDAPIEGDVAL